jgi:hypothetical protein
MKKIFWILVLGAVGSAAMAVGLGQAASKQQDTKQRH